MAAEQTQLALLAEAIDTERKGYRFYTEAAARAVSEKARETLLSLAEDERYHESVLEEQRRALQASGSWAVEEAEKAAGHSKGRPRPSIIPSDRKKTVAIARASKDELAALQVGMRIEQASYRFYLRAAEQVGAPAVNDLYRSLAAWENSHFLVLQEMHDFLSDPEGWYLKEERPILEG